MSAASVSALCEESIFRSCALFSTIGELGLVLLPVGDILFLARAQADFAFTRVHALDADHHGVTQPELVVLHVVLRPGHNGLGQKAGHARLIVAVTFNVPCLMALSATMNETHSLKWTLRIAFYYIASALILS